MDERLRFVARLLDGERMTTLCTEFGISRKTGYKIYRGYQGRWPSAPDRPQSAPAAARESAADDIAVPISRRQTRCVRRHRLQYAARTDVTVDGGVEVRFLTVTYAGQFYHRPALTLLEANPERARVGVRWHLCRNEASRPCHRWT
jgi:Homeodomain-like domain